ncbi:MAG TPA: ABC transporter permease subunit [Blastocatellia bacterium]|nr:ABC transporter permease subunit [Blastocatellia bacterium]
MAILLGGLLVCWRVAEIHPSSLWDPAALAAVGTFVSHLFPPDLSLRFLRIVALAAGQTMAIAVVSTSISAVLGLLLGFWATPVLWESGVLLAGEPPGWWRFGQSSFSRLVRVVLGFLRAVPDLVWALLFVVAVGLGPLAGTLALAVSYTGVLGRVYGHLFEDVDPGSLEALQAAGATRTQVFLRAIWPQASSNVLAYTLFSFECCVRAAAVLGFIGAGGIGYQINLSMRLFEYGQVLTLIVALLVMVAVTESGSRMLRRRLQPNGATGSRRSSLSVGARRRFGFGKQLFMLTALFGAAANLEATGFLSGRLGDAEMLTRIGGFVARMFPPNFEIEFLRSLLRPLVQTVAISVIGTLMGIVTGAALALPATSTFILSEREAAGRRIWIEQAFRWSVYASTRLVLNALRSIPELVWVLICILAVGLGPFAGTLAIGLHTGGVLGKLYAEIIEETPVRPIEAMRAIGGRPLQLLLYAVWPQARPTLISYTILRWEMNLRVSTILGLVGGGGLGQIIYNDVQLGFYSNLATLIILVYLLVLATDWVSHRWRAHSRVFQRELPGRPLR